MLFRSNLVRVSSIFPPHCKLIARSQGLKYLHHGEVVFAVIYQSARTVLENNREPMQRIADALLEREVLDANEIKLLIEGKELPRKTPAPDEGTQQVLKPEPGRAPSLAPGEKPATA